MPKIVEFQSLSFITQLEAVVNKLRERGDRVLVILPFCYTQKAIPNSIRRKERERIKLLEEEERFLKKLEEDDMLYVVQGGDDDWFWMMVTVLEGRKSPAFVITNDLMRDHKLAFLEPRPFTRWRMTHVMNFNVGVDQEGNAKVTIEDPGIPYLHFLESCYIVL